MALTDVIIDRARSLHNSHDCFLTYRQKLGRLEDVYGFIEMGDETSEKLAFTLITLDERYGKVNNLKELRQLKESLISKYKVIFRPVSSKPELHRREWLILFVATQIARRL